MMSIKKIIFLSVSLVLLIVSLVLSVGRLNIRIALPKDGEKIDSIVDVEKVMKSLNGMLKSNTGDSESNIEIDYKNMTVSAYSQYSIFIGSEYREYGYSDYGDYTGNYFSSSNDKAKVKRNMDIYFTENATYYSIDLVLTATSKFSEVLENSETRQNYNDSYSSTAFYDLSMDLYIESDNVYIKFDKLTICEYSKNNSEKYSNIIDLITDDGVELYGKWIDISNSSYLANAINWSQEYNLSFFQKLQDNIVEYNEGGNNFVKQGNSYAMNDINYKKLLNTLTASNSLNALKDEKIKGGLDLSINNEELLFELVFKYGDIQTINGDRKFSDVEFDCVEDDNIKVYNVNNTKIEEISKEDVLIYDMEQLLEDVFA